MSAQTVAEYLGGRGARISEAELVASIDAALGDRLASPQAAALSESARDFLVMHGGITRRDPHQDNASEVLTASVVGHVAASLESALTAREAADVLGIDASRVRHRLAARSLYGLRAGRKSLFPAWQFADGSALPHLARVLAALPADLHPLEVAEFFTEPQPELLVDDAEVAPRQWLAHGGDPAPVVAAAASLAYAP